MLFFILFLFSFLLVIFFFLWLFYSFTKVNKVAAGISEAGYEAAADILYPRKKDLRFIRRWGLGPVLPE